MTPAPAPKAAANICMSFLLAKKHTNEPIPVDMDAHSEMRSAVVRALNTIVMILKPSVVVVVVIQIPNDYKIVEKFKKKGVRLN